MPVEAANFSMTAIPKTRADVLAAPPAKRDGAVARPRAGGRLPGRLNLFQTAMLGWRDLHPYNAVHAACIGRALDRDALERAIRETLAHAGLTGLELDRRRRRYAWRGGPSRVTVDVLPSGGDWRETLARAFERELNAPFPRDGMLEPFRFFALDLGNSFFLGLAYDHFIAGGDSIVVLLSTLAGRYIGGQTGDAPLARYPRTHRRLFVRHPLAFCRSLARLPAMGASCRRTIRPRYRPVEEGHNAFRFFTLDADRYAALRAAARSFGVTLNDVLIAILLLAQDATSPARDRNARRSELAVASIMNLREAHGDDAHRTFGQFLSSFRVAHPVPPGIALRELAQDVHRTTARQARAPLPRDAYRGRPRPRHRPVPDTETAHERLRQELSGRCRDFVAERRCALGRRRRRSHAALCARRAHGTDVAARAGDHDGKRRAVRRPVVSHGGLHGRRDH